MLQLELKREMNYKKSIMFFEKLFKSGIITKVQMNIATNVCAEKLSLKKVII